MSELDDAPERELSEADREQLSRYLAGELEAAEREEFEARVLTDGALARELYLQQGLAAAVAAVEVRSAPAARSAVLRLPRWLPPRQALLAAAAVVVVAGAWAVLYRGRGEDRMRGDGGGPRLLAPIGELAAAPVEFRWSRDPAAAEYRFELHDAAGRVVHVALTQDTVLRLGTGGREPVAPARGSWRVVPLAAGGHELPAPATATYGPR